MVQAPPLPEGAKFAVLPGSDDGGSDASLHRRGAAGNLAEGEIVSGSGYCRGTRVELKLVVKHVDGDQIEGVVEMTVVRASTRGSYHVSGSYESGTQHLKLEAGDWIDELDEMEASDLDGRISDQTYSGRLTASGCGGFTLRRDPTRGGGDVRK